MNTETKLIVATGTTKVKKTARSWRIWIEGNKLLKAGFVPEARYSVHSQVETDDYPARICLKLDANGDRKVTKASRNGKARPIIDLHERLIVEIFPAVPVVEVAYLSTGFILISEVQS
jgi:hypothetical protein